MQSATAQRFQYRRPVELNGYTLDLILKNGSMYLKKAELAKLQGLSVEGVTGKMKVQDFVDEVANSALNGVYDARLILIEALAFNLYLTAKRNINRFQASSLQFFKDPDDGNFCCTPQALNSWHEEQLSFLSPENQVCYALNERGFGRNIEGVCYTSERNTLDLSMLELCLEAAAFIDKDPVCLKAYKSCLHWYIQGQL